MSKSSTRAKSMRARSRRGTTQADEAFIPFEVAVVEASQAGQQRARELIDQLGYKLAVDVEVQNTLGGRLRREPPQAVLVGLPERADIAGEILKLPDRPLVIGSLAAPAATARARAEQAGADLFTLRPHSRDSLAAVLHAAERIAALDQQVRALRGSEELLRERMRRFGQSDLATNFFHMEFFERVLVMELKRARRYGYSLAACLVGLDAWQDQPPPPPPVAVKLRTQVATAIAAIVRDIDMPVDLAEDRMLVFLPYADLDGALRVGKRIAASVARQRDATDGGGQSWRASVSIGIAALKPGKPVSFARLMREASSALKAAQLRGGDQVVVRR
jgi:diguanylate cyclase (GGDEF)-like protein